jgi:hypothetical protein
MRHDQIEIGGAAAFPSLVFCGYKRRRRQRHQLPGTKEGDEIAGDKHDFDRTQEHVEGSPEERGPSVPVWPSDVSKTEDGDRNGDDGEDQKKPR